MWRMCAGNHNDCHCTHTALLWNSMGHNKGTDYIRHSGHSRDCPCQGILLLRPRASPPPMWLGYKAIDIKFRDSGGQLDPNCISISHSLWSHARITTVDFAHVQESWLLILSTLLTCENHDCRLCSRARITTVDFVHVRESRLSTLLTCENHDCRLCPLV